MSVGAAGEMLRIVRGEDPVNLVDPGCRANSLGRGQTMRI